jgi:tripartite-type tricarboxylate transporter receptor subunit TctC
MHAYVLTAPKRMPSLPDVPTAAEVGMPSLDIGAWYGFYAPVGTPKPIIEQLNHALRDVVQDPAVAAQLEKIETYLLPLDQATPEALRQKLASQIALWRPIIEKAGIQAE